MYLLYFDTIQKTSRTTMTRMSLKRTSSKSEVVVQMCQRWGINPMLSMFFPGGALSRVSEKRQGQTVGSCKHRRIPMEVRARTYGVVHAEMSLTEMSAMACHGNASHRVPLSGSLRVAGTQDTQVRFSWAGGELSNGRFSPATHVSTADPCGVSHFKP